MLVCIKRTKLVCVGKFELTVTRWATWTNFLSHLMCHQTKLDVTGEKSITVKTTGNRLVIDQRSQGITG